MTEQRNLILAIVLSIAILLGFQFLFEAPRIEQRQAEQARQQALQTEQSVDLPAPSLSQPAEAALGREGLIAKQFAEGQRVRIDTPDLHGSINLVSGRIDDLTLADYHATPEPTSPEIVLLAPAESPEAYYAEFGWIPEERSLKVPDAETRWTTAGDAKLTPDTPVTLTWDNGEGLVFERTIAVDRNYMFTVTQKVRNLTDSPVRLLPYGLANRKNTPQTLGFFILHEGPLGVFDGTLNELDYDDMRESGTITRQTTGGWIGITDKYWLVSLIPDQDDPVTARFLHRVRNNQDRYQVDIMGAPMEIAPGGEGEQISRVFAGAKQVRLLDHYAATLGIKNFDLAIDFGWFYFLTKPFFYALDFLAGLFGNFGVAILIFTVFVKLAFFPLANKSYVAMSRMKKLQPEVMRIRERFEDDKMRMNQEMMALYKREKVNPVSGCLPILIQIPVFFALYKVLFVTIEMRHAPFFGWIHDLSAPDPTSIFNLFGLIPWDPPALLMIGVWPLLMGVTMWAQMKLNPTPPDPIQQKIFTFLPIVFTFMLASFPAGLVIYWAWNNLLSIAQQWVIMRKEGVSIT